MKIEQNTISRDWKVCYLDRKFLVSFVQSDGLTLALCNRDNWEIWEETNEGTQELDIYVFNDSTSARRKAAHENAAIAQKLIRFCVINWDNKFLRDIKKEFHEWKEQEQ